MRVDVSCKYLDKSSIIEEAIEKNIKKIERRVKIFHRDDSIHVSVHLEKNPNKERYSCRLQVYLPQHTLTADEGGNTPSKAIRLSFAAVNKQFDKLKYKIETHLRKNNREKVGMLVEPDPDLE